MTTHPDNHYQLLTDVIPPWLGQASPARHQALAQALPPAPLLPATRAQKAELKRLNAAHWSAQNAVDNALQHLQDAKTFARPLLEDELLKRYGLDLKADTTFVRLYIPQTATLFSIPTGAARTWTVSLLDAALHNFDAAEAQEGAFEPASTFISQPSATGQFDTLPAIRERMSILAFTQLCRELDLGAQYHRHVRTQLGFGEPVASAVLKHDVNTSQKAALRAALHLARLQGDVGEDFARQVEGLLEDRPMLMLFNKPLKCYDVQMMGASLTGILLLAPDLETSRSVQPVVAYVPDDPQHPLKEYPSALAFKQELTRQLRTPQYQAFFSRFINHAQRGVFFADLSQRLARITWHAPERGSDLPPWRSEPTNDPKLQFVATPIQGNTWQYLYQRKLDKILNDARTLAVATADADRNARWALWDSIVNVASSILNAALLVVAPFVPGLGELMLGYMAYQLLDDAFEGVIDWAEGLTREAFTQLMSVLQTLVQLGTFAAGGHIGVTELRNALPADTLAFIDRFKPVKLANGAERYWKPDLTPYQHGATLPTHAYPNALGLYPLHGETLLPLEGKLYAVQKQAGRDDYIITHPTRADAYTPTLSHNTAGAWRTELDQPLQWDRDALLRRIGHPMDGLSAADQTLALHISGVDDAMLRKMHVNSAPLPALLDDTLARLRIDRTLHTLIERLNSDDPEQHRKIEPQDELHLLTSFGDWPATHALQLLDAEGGVAWAFGDPRLPVVQVHEAQLDSGQLLKTVLQALPPDELHTLFGERLGDPQPSLETRVKQLRKKLARTAERNRSPLFDSRYGILQHTEDSHARQIQLAAPQLPASVTNRLLEQASGEELQALDSHHLPARMAEEARAAQSHVQVNRAYEGLHLDAVQSQDSERLALNSLKTLAGWSPDVRFDVRQLTRDGATWLQIGPKDAAVQRTLVRTADGLYVPHGDKGPLFGETDLYTAILNALPDTERDALALGVNQGAQLKQRLRQSAVPREEVRTALGIGRLDEPARKTLRHLGSDDGYRAQAPGPSHTLTLSERARELFPTLDQAQLRDLLTHLNAQPNGAANGLAALAAEYRQLDFDLSVWQNQAPTAFPRNGSSLNLRQQYYELRNRRLFADQLRRCWRRETGVDAYYNNPARDGHILRLEYPIIGALPQLAANFDHVSLLTLTGTPNTNAAAAFLQRFSMVRHLEIRGINLGEIPGHIHTLPNLKALSLSNCNIVLTPASHARLAAMSHLQTLVLNDNPLGLVPSVEAMHDLAWLDLANTGIDRVPAGVLTRTELHAVRLNNNRISELPSSLFELAPLVSRRFDLSGNPLSRASLENIKAYFQQHNTYWEADALPADVRDASLLFPSLNPELINRFIYALPGNIEAGTIELARLTAELDTLRQELDSWEQTPGMTLTEYARRSAVRQLLERSWRREAGQGGQLVHALTFPRQLAGELPTISTTFPHIGSLIVNGNGSACNIAELLGNFPQLDILDIEGVPLGDVPLQIASLEKLTFLGLPHCSIQLSAPSRLSLERMTRLQYLDLSHNPIGQPLDFTHMPDLYGVVLQNTGLTEVPRGLLTATPRGTVDLSRNAIQQLEPLTYTLPGDSLKGVDLSANPLTLQTLEQIKTYCQRTHEDMNADAPAAERARAMRLYPVMTDSEADHFIFMLPGDLQAVGPTLQRLEAEYEQLTTDLQQWMLDVPERHPLLDIALDPTTRAQEQLARGRYKTLLEQAWRREGPDDEESLDDERSHALVLDLPILGALPELSARFEHISAFEISGGRTITQVDGLLGCFPRLQSLALSQCTLNTLPRAIFSMPRLTSLEVSRCAIRLTTTSAREVSELQTLEFLDMSDNPLEQAPDVSGLQHLTSLHLHGCLLREVPNGIFQLRQLQTLDLSANQIRELPADLLEMVATYHDDSDLSSNPWSAASLDYLRQYYQRTGMDFQMLEATQDVQGNPLEAPMGQPMEE